MSDGDFDSGGGSFGTNFGVGGSETSYQGWFQRLMSSLVGVLVGLLLFVVSFPVLFINEGHAVRVAEDLDAGEKSVVSVPADKVDPANNNKLVHVSGVAATEQVLEDPDFGVKEKVLRLRRQVEVYQYKEIEEKEEEKQFGGGVKTVTRYKYEPVWSASLIDSSRFRNPQMNVNPTTTKFSSREVDAEKVTLGAFQLSKGLLAQDQNFKPAAMPTSLPPAARDARATIQGDAFYIAGPPNNPTAGNARIGDTRITVSVVPAGPVSVVARQSGDTFEPFKLPRGTTMEKLSVGTVSAEQMFEASKAENTMWLWILRVVGFILMFIGISLVFQPLVVLADVVPFFGDLLGFGAGLFAFFVAVPLTLITIAIGWLAARPLLGIALLVAAGAMLFGAVYLARSMRRPTPRVAR